MSNIRTVNPKDVVVCKENGQPRWLSRQEMVMAILEGRVISLSKRQIQPILADSKLWRQLPEETRSTLISCCALLNTLLMQTKACQSFPEILSDYSDNISVLIPPQFRRTKGTRMEIDLKNGNFTTESYKGGILLHLTNQDEVIQAARFDALSNVDCVRLLACGGADDFDIFDVRWSVVADLVSGYRFRVIEQNATAKVNGNSDNLAALAKKQ